MELSRLEEVLKKLRYVKSGDIVSHMDHNYLVEACKTMKELLWDRLGIPYYPTETLKVRDEFRWAFLLKKILEDTISVTDVFSYEVAVRTDPYDPTWTRPEGWTKVWNFDVEADINYFNYKAPDYYTIANGILSVDPPTGEATDGVREFYGTMYWRRTAICVRFKSLLSVVTTVLYGWFRMYTSYEFWRETVGEFGLLYGDGNIRVKHDGYEILDMTVDYGKWYILVIDIDDMKLWLYDENKNLLVEHYIETPTSTDETWIRTVLKWGNEDIIFGNPYTYLFEVDWICELQTTV